MQCGVYVPNFGAFGSARTLADVAADAEAAGWDGVFIWDHIARPFSTDLVDPWVALAAIALRTTRVRIGALVTPLPRRRPWKVARETVSLDRLSTGRLVFGVGSGSPGGRDVEWASFGEALDGAARGAMLDEALAVLTRLWSGERVSFAGRHYHVRSAQFRPTPLQSPRIPIWVAATWPHQPPLRRAARWDGVFPWFGRDAESIERLTSVVSTVRAPWERRTLRRGLRHPTAVTRRPRCRGMGGGRRGGRNLVVGAHRARVLRRDAAGSVAARRDARAHPSGTTAPGVGPAVPADDALHGVPAPPSVVPGGGRAPCLRPRPAQPLRSLPRRSNSRGSVPAHLR